MILLLIIIPIILILYTIIYSICRILSKCSRMEENAKDKNDLWFSLWLTYGGWYNYLLYFII